MPIQPIDFSGLGNIVGEFDRSRATAMKMRAARDALTQQRQAQQWAQNFQPGDMTRAQQLQAALQAGAVNPNQYFGHLPDRQMNEYQRAQVGMAEQEAAREQQLANEQSQAQIIWAMENLPNMTEKKAKNLQRAGAMPKLMERWLAKPDGAGTKLGKLREDLDAGLIDQQQFDAAVSKELSPSGGIVFETNPDGTTSLRVGGSGGGDLTTATKTGIQKKQLDAAEMGARVSEIRDQFRPEFQTYKTRLGSAWRSIKAKVDPSSLSETEKAELGRFATFRATAIDNVNRLLNELSGAAVSPQEAVRIRQSMPDPGDGIFDGDDPVSFEAKTDRALESADKALARYRFYQAKGTLPGSLDKIPLSNIKQVDNAWYVKEGGKWYEVE